MAWTLETLKQAARDYMDADEDTLNANLDNIIRKAEERILRDVQLTAFRKTTTAIQLVPNDPFVEYPDDLLAVYSMAVISTTTGHRNLIPKDPSAIREMYP